MKDLAQKIKKKYTDIPQHTREIIETSVAVTVMTVTCSLVAGKIAEKLITNDYPKGGVTYLGIRQSDFEKFNANGEKTWPYYLINGHKFVIEMFPEK